MGALVLDTSVVIGFIRADDAHHTAAKAALHAAGLRHDTLVLPASVLSEAMVAPHSVGDGVAESMRRSLVRFFGPVRVLDEEVADAAARLRASHRSLRLPDALVIATGIVDDGVVLTCDKRLGVVDDRVQVLTADP